jgi:hypothetical protein
MGLAELHALLVDPRVAQVAIEIGVETTERLHAELVQLYVFCLTRECDDLTLATRASVARVGAMFAKLGVACHVDAPAPTETPLSRLVACVALPSGVHTLRFSLAPPDREPCHAAALRFGPA